MGQKSNVINRSFRLVIIGKQSRRQLTPIFQILTSRKRQLERRVVQVERNKHAGKTRKKHQPQNPKDIDVRQLEKLVSSVVHQQACCRSEDSHPHNDELTSVKRQREKSISPVVQRTSKRRFREHTTRNAVTSTKLQLKKSVVQIVHTGTRTKFKYSYGNTTTITRGHQTRRLEKPVATVARDVFVNKTGTSQGRENI